MWASTADSPSASPHSAPRPEPHPHAHTYTLTQVGEHVGLEPSASKTGGLEGAATLSPSPSLTRPGGRTSTVKPRMGAKERAKAAARASASSAAQAGPVEVTNQSSVNAKGEGVKGKKKRAKTAVEGMSGVVTPTAARGVAGAPELVSAPPTASVFPDAATNDA